MRNHRPRKWEQVFGLLEKARKEDDADYALAAQRWANKWSNRGREDTSLGRVMARVIDDIIGYLRHRPSKARTMSVNASISALKELVAREAKVSRVHAIMARTRSQEKRPATEHEIANAIRAATVAFFGDMHDALAKAGNKKRRKP